MYVMIKRYLPRGLWARTLLILILPIFILQGLGVYLFYERHWDKLADRLANSVAGDIAMVSEWYEQDQNFLSTDQRVRLKRYTGLDVTTSNPHITKNRDVVSYSYLSNALNRNLDGRVFSVTKAFGGNIAVKVQTMKGFLVFEIPHKRLYSSTTYIFVLWLVFLTVILLILSAFLLRRQMKPIMRLAKATIKDNVDLSLLKLEGADEVRQATAAFLDMQERIKRDTDQKNEIFTNVRKDLQQPIDRMKLTVDKMMATHPDTPSMMADLRLMERMIDGYLSYARDNQDEPLSVKNLRELVHDAKSLSGANQVKIQQSNTKDINMSVRALAFKRALANIMRNAQNRDASLMVVDARTIQTDDGAMHLIALEDNGRILTDKDIAFILNPISAKLNKKHSGDFGLTIAVDIVESHGGIMNLTHGVKGLRVSMMLPA